MNWGRAIEVNFTEDCGLSLLWTHAGLLTVWGVWPFALVVRCWQ